MKKIFNRFVRYSKRIIKIVLRPEMKVLPGQISFFMVLSLIPLVTVIGLIASQFSIPLSNLIAIITESLPSEISNIITPVLSSPGSVSIYSMILGFYIASNGTCSIIIASNMLFKLEESDIVKRRIKGLFMLVLIVILLLFMLVVLGFGNTIFNLILEYFEIVLPDFTHAIFLMLKWPVGIFIIFFIVKLILTSAPNERIPSKYMNRGAVFITFTWIIATGIYSIYVNNFANYNVFYSSLANIVVLMFWIYIISYTLVVGIAINSEGYLAMQKLEEEKEENKK